MCCPERVCWVLIEPIIGNFAPGIFHVLGKKDQYLYRGKMGGSQLKILLILNTGFLDMAVTHSSSQRLTC